MNASSIYCTEKFRKSYKIKDKRYIHYLMVLSQRMQTKKALDNVNRMKNLYYDSNYKLVIKKDNSK